MFSIASILGLIPDSTRQLSHRSFFFPVNACKKLQTTNLEGSGERWGTPVAIVDNKKIRRVRDDVGIERFRHQVCFIFRNLVFTQCDSDEMVPKSLRTFRFVEKL